MNTAAVKATESGRNAAVEATSNVEDFRCEICDFRSNKANGLRIHMSRKHARIEQLDGNTSLPSQDQIDEDTAQYLIELGGCFKTSTSPSPHSLLCFILTKLLLVD